MFMPFQILGIWFRGFLALALLATGFYLLSRWYDEREVSVVEAPAEPPAVGPVVDSEDRAGTAVVGLRADGREARVRTEYWHFGRNRPTAFLVGGLALLGWSLGGGWILNPRWRRKVGKNEPRSDNPGDVERVRLPDGSEISLRKYGPVDGDPIVLTHGWGFDHNEWFYAKQELSKGHRLIVWDLPGLGTSDRPKDRDWSLERLAKNLALVINSAGPKPVTLLGHSIGGMITLTYCKLFPEALENRVRALVVTQSTYTNPVKTTSKAWLYRALQKPVLEPLCWLMIGLSPIVRVLNWLSFANGSAHRSTERDSFSGNETRGQLDFVTKYYTVAPPDVIARGMLAMMHYDATDILSGITVPTLVVAGDRDKSTLPEASRHMASTMPNAELVILSDARHCGLFEHHQSFHSAVRTFMTKVDTERPIGRPHIAAARAKHGTG